MRWGRHTVPAPHSRCGPNDLSCVHPLMNTGKSQMAIQKHFRNPLLATSALLVSLAWALPASAQVQKCVDPVTGKITFSDRGCSTGEETTTVRIAPANSVDGSQYRQQQSEPTYPHAGHMPRIEPERSGPRVTGVGTSNDADRQRQKLCKEASTPHKRAHGLTAAQRAAAAQLCAGITLPSPATNSAPAQAPMPAPSPVPALIVNCDAGGCWDSNGQRYNRGAGATHFPANGGPACQLTGGQMICP